MDFITQNLLGAVAGHATLGRRREQGGLGRLAVLAGAMGGALPDFDFLLKPFADPALPFEYHRHLTHALLFIPLGGLLAALPFLLLKFGRRHFGRLLMATTVGCATHAPLDNLTSYGTHLLWPFSAHRTAWDAMSIIDPIFTGVLLLGLIVALVGARPRATRVAMTAALLYIGLGFVQHDRAMDTQRQLAERRGHDVQRVRVHPTLGNIIVFRSVYEAEGRLWADAIRVSPLGTVGVRDGTSVARFTEDDLPDSFPDRARHVFRGLDAFAGGFLARVEPADGDASLILGDMRISMETDGFRALWGVAYDDAGAPRAWRAFRRQDDSAGAVLGGMWDDVVNPDGRFRPVQDVRLESR